jgi:hypothetical protein
MSRREGGSVSGSAFVKTLVNLMFRRSPAEAFSVGGPAPDWATSKESGA